MKRTALLAGLAVLGLALAPAVAHSQELVAPPSSVAAPPPAGATGAPQAPAAPPPKGAFNLDMAGAAYRANMAFAAVRNRNFEEAIRLYQEAAQIPGGQRYAKMIERVQKLRDQFNQYQSNAAAAPADDPGKTRLEEDPELEQQYWLGWNRDQTRSPEQIQADIDAAMRFYRGEFGTNYQVNEEARTGAPSRHVLGRTRERLSTSVPGYTNLQAQEAMNNMP